MVLAVVIAGGRLLVSRSQPGPPEVVAPGEYQVDRVVDGDTLLLTNRARIRLLGIDCPEIARAPDVPSATGSTAAVQSAQLAQQASEFTSRLIADGHVRLSFDRERIDPYDRFLAYVWVGDRLLNEELLRAGLARRYRKATLSYAMDRRYSASEQAARRAGLGLWAFPSAGKSPTPDR